MRTNLTISLALAASLSLPACTMCTANGSGTATTPAQAAAHEPATAGGERPVTAPAATAATAAPAPTPAAASPTAPAAAVATATAPDLGTEEQKTVYALGLTVASNLKNFALSEEELGLVLAGIRDGLGGGAPMVDHQEYQPRIRQLAQTRVEAIAEEERRASALFVEKMAGEQGAQKYDTGMVIIPITEGGGAVPLTTDTVKVHYHGTLRDGSVFDSSVERGQPATFPLNRVIPCWSEGLQRMKVGGKMRLVCPSSIAYGDRGSPPKIKPGAALLFEIELLGIETPGGASSHP